MTAPDPTIIADEYGAARVRIGALLRDLGADEWRAPVPACPDWSVHDVLAHLVGVIEDATAGRLSGPPGEDQTALQVARHRDDDPSVLLDEWHRMAPGFQSMIAAAAAWPALFDVLSHEHDLRGALGRPGARDTDGVRVAAELLLRWCRTTVPFAVELDGERTVIVRDHQGRSHADGLALSTTSFEVLRLRLGRRSPRQVVALDWTGDPAGVLGELFTFGPAELDLVE